MARLYEHSNCPNPVQWGSSPVKTVYVRDTDPGTGKLKWRPVGFICTGCGVFRADKGWYPSGKAEPVCHPWQPSRDGDPGPAQDIDAETEEILAVQEDLEGPRVETGISAEITNIEVYQEPPAEIEDSAHDGDDNPPAEAKAGRRPGRPVTRISPEMAATVLQISPDAVREKLQAGEIPARKDPWRHWRIDVPWFRDRCREAGVPFPGEVADAEV